MYVNLFFDGLMNGELLTFKTGPPCIRNIIFLNDKFGTFSKLLVYELFLLTYVTKISCLLIHLISSNVSIQKLIFIQPSFSN